ncbi:hypothetical protein M8C21_025937, partial [Ambrosia artemisiifolia]
AIGEVASVFLTAAIAIQECLIHLSSLALRALGFAYKEDQPEFTTYNGDEDHPVHNQFRKSHGKIDENKVYNWKRKRKIDRLVVTEEAIDIRNDPQFLSYQSLFGIVKANVSLVEGRTLNRFGGKGCSVLGRVRIHDSFVVKDPLIRKFVKPLNTAEQQESSYCHKPEITRTQLKKLKDLGEVIAMTGDGVNDAAALKLAEIGKVVKEASDMVVAAVGEA